MVLTFDKEVERLLSPEGDLLLASLKDASSPAPPLPPTRTTSKDDFQQLLENSAETTRGEGRAGSVTSGRNGKQEEEEGGDRRIEVRTGGASSVGKEKLAEEEEALGTSLGSSLVGENASSWLESTMASVSANNNNNTTTASASNSTTASAGHNTSSTTATTSRSSAVEKLDSLVYSATSSSRDVMTEMVSSERKVVVTSEAAVSVTTASSSKEQAAIPAMPVVTSAKERGIFLLLSSQIKMSLNLCIYST
jgi:hypothetical protein